MLKSESHYFKFKYEKFISATKDYTAEQVGGYLLLLCYQWDKEYIPLEEVEQKKISKVSDKSLKIILKKFKIKKRGLQNEVMRKDRSDYMKYCKDQAGRAKQKKQTHKPTLSHGNANALPREGYKIREDKNKIREEGNTTPEGFETDSKVFLEDQIWKEQACMSYGLEMKDLESDMRQFINNLRLAEKFKPLSELRSYYVNILVKRDRESVVKVSSSTKIKHDIDN